MMKLTAGTFSMFLLAGSLLAAQRCPDRNSPGVNGPAVPSASASRPSNTKESAMPSDNGGNPTRDEELAFSRLRIEEVERQARGTVKGEDAIPAQERVFVDAQSWRAFWSRYDGEQLPEVDFEKYRVAAVFLGASGPGHDIQVRKVTFDARERLTTVHVVELLPDPQKIYATVIVYPADVVVFPARPGAVAFVRTKKTRGD